MTTAFLARQPLVDSKEFIKIVGLERYSELMAMKGKDRRSEIARCFSASAQSLLEVALLIWSAVRDGEDISEFDRDRVEVYLHVAEGRLLFELAEVAGLTARPNLGRRIARLTLAEQGRIAHDKGRIQLVVPTERGKFDVEMHPLVDLLPRQLSQVLSNRHDRLRNREEQILWIRENPLPKITRTAKISADVTPEEKRACREWCKKNGKNMGEHLRQLLVEQGLFGP